jgi:prefoldin subunit 5
MIKLKIKKLSDTSIRMEQPSKIPGRAPVVQHFPRQFKAIDENEASNRVTVKTDESPFTCITVFFNEIEINDGSTVTVPASVEEAVTLLNSFIGNFNTAGGTAETTLEEMQESLQDVEESVQETKESLQDVEEALTWN